MTLIRRTNPLGELGSLRRVVRSGNAPQAAGSSLAVDRSEADASPWDRGAAPGSNGERRERGESEAQ